MIERHIEKVVLCLCVLLLMYAVFHWAISSPRQIKVTDRNLAVPPDEVDLVLEEEARGIDESVRSVKPEPYRDRDFASDLKKLQETPFEDLGLPVELGFARAPLPQVEDAEPPKPTSLEALLAVIPKPNRPQVTVEWELLRVEMDSNDVLAGHVAATYPWGNLDEKWREVLEETIIQSEIVVVGVEAEVRERHFDGTWGTPRAVKTIRAPLLSSAGMPIPIPELKDFDGSNGEEVILAKRELKEEWQEEMLEPGYWDIWWPSQKTYGTWQINLPSTTVSEKYKKTLSEPEKTKQDLRAARGFQLPGASRVGRRWSGQGQGQSQSQGQGIRGSAARRSRISGRRPRRVAKFKQPAPLAPTVVPPLADQITNGEVLFWIHDLSLESSKVYQYRVRLVLANPLLAFTGHVEKESDAGQATIRTPFSEWSDRVVAPRATEFFVTNRSELQRYVKVEVFRYALGQWVRHAFNVHEGDPIGQKKKEKLIDPVETSSVSKEVDYSTGAVAIRFDFTKKVQKGSIPRPYPTVEMIYLDEAGQLKTRVGLLDRNSQRYKQLREETERTRTPSRVTPGYSRGS